MVACLQKQRTFKLEVNCKFCTAFPIIPIATSSKADARAVDRNALESKGRNPCEMTHKVNDLQKAVADASPEIGFNAFFATFVA